MIALKGPEGSECQWVPTLAHIQALEGAYGSLYALGAALLTQSLPLSSVAGAVKMLLRQAGCLADEAALDAFVLGQPCTAILVDVLLAVLEPVERGRGGAPDAAFLAAMMKEFPDTERKKA